MQTFKDSIKTIILSSIIIFAVSIAYAWTEPASNPPAGNTSAPVSTSGGQIVEGGLVLGNSAVTNGLIVKNGNVGIGVTDPGIYKLNVNGNVSVNDVYITSVGKWASELYPVNLVNGIHTNIQCSAAGGTVVDDGTGNKMCKFTTSSCPATWTKYNNWTTTAVKTASYSNEGCTPVDIGGSACYVNTATCSTTSHTWVNAIVETKTCNGAQAQYYVDSQCNEPCPKSCPPNRNSGHDGTNACTGGTNTSITATITEIGCY